MVTKKSNKGAKSAIEVNDFVTNATELAGKQIVDMAQLLESDPVKFAALDAAIKNESLRLRKNQGIIKVLSGKNVNEKCWNEISTDAEIIASGLEIVKGTKKVYDAKKEVVVDAVKYDSPAAIAMRDSKLLKAVDENAVIEGDIIIAKFDSRLDNSTVISAQLGQLSKGIREAKRQAHIKDQEAILAKKTTVRRSVAELAKALGFTTIEPVASAN